MISIDDYMKLNYKVNIRQEKDFDHTQYFVASYEELNGLEGIGDTKNDAIKDLNIAKEVWFQVMLDNGEEIPLPSD